MPGRKLHLAHEIMALLPEDVGVNTAFFMLATSSPKHNSDNVTIHTGAVIPSRRWNDKAVVQLLVYLIDKVAAEGKFDARLLAYQIGDVIGDREVARLIAETRTRTGPTGQKGDTP
jgi:hypothetical protein